MRILIAILVACIPAGCGKKTAPTPKVFHGGDHQDVPDSEVSSEPPRPVVLITTAPSPREISEEEFQLNRVKRDLKAIVSAYIQFESKENRWPLLTEVPALLENGDKQLVDPWGQVYRVTIIVLIRRDGGTFEHPLASCLLPTGKVMIWPEAPPEG
jgi:hypothetical protein